MKILAYTCDVCNKQCLLSYFVLFITLSQLPKLLITLLAICFGEKVCRSIYFSSIFLLFHWWKLVQNLGIAAPLFLDQVPPQLLAFTGWAVATYWHLENGLASDKWARQTSSLVPETKCSPRQMVCDTAPHLHSEHNCYFVESLQHSLEKLFSHWVD